MSLFLHSNWRGARYADVGYGALVRAGDYRPFFGSNRAGHFSGTLRVELDRRCAALLGKPVKRAGGTRDAGKTFFAGGGSMTRIVMLGIGGMDADLLRVYGPSLPNLRRMMLHSPFLEMQSCFPPEPGPAWASIYTGQHPANHGIIERVDYLVENKERELPYMTLTHEETFWMRASEAGKRVCIVNPFPLYEPKPVNGVMLTLSNNDEQMVLVLPPDAVPGEGFPPLLDNIAIPK